MIPLLGVLVARWIAQAPSEAHPEAVPRYAAVPAFDLRDHRDEPISLASLRGRVWVADFIFTRCAGQCPMMQGAMARLAASLDAAEAARVTLISFSVDPAWDTPERLARYAASQAPARAPWRFVTGEPEAIERLCREGFRLAMADGAGTPEEPITHSTRLVLVDAEGTIRGYYDAAEREALGRLQQDLRRLLRDAS